MDDGLHQKLGRGKAGSTQSLRAISVLLTPWFQTSSLQNQERVGFLLI